MWGQGVSVRVHALACVGGGLRGSLEQDGCTCVCSTGRRVCMCVWGKGGGGGVLKTRGPDSTAPGQIAARPKKVGHCTCAL